MTTLRTTIDTVRHLPTARRVLHRLLRCAASGALDRSSEERRHGPSPPGEGGGRGTGTPTPAIGTPRRRQTRPATRPPNHAEGDTMTTLRTTIDTVRHLPTARRVLHCLLRCAASGALDRFSRTTHTSCPRN